MVPFRSGPAFYALTIFLLLAGLGLCRADLPELGTAEAIRLLTPAQAAKHQPVRIRGIITFYDSHIYSWFIQDRTAGIYFYADRISPAPVLIPGQEVEVEGETSPGEFAPVITPHKVTVLGKGNFPNAQPVSYQDISSGQEDSQFIELEGTVRSVSFIQPDNYYFIKVATGDGFVTAMASALPVNNPESLVDCTVQLRGICASQFNLQRQIFDLRLLVPRAEDLLVKNQASADPFAQPARRIEEIMQFVPKTPRGHRVKLSGVVTYRRDDSRLFIQNEKEGLLVETFQRGPLLPGDEIEVVGFPAKGLYTPKLEDAIFRKVSTKALPIPVAIESDDALKGIFDYRLVKITGTLLDRTRYGHEQFLVLQSGGFIFNAYLEHKEGGLNFAYLENGSKLSVTGVCLIDPGEDWHVGPDWRAKSFRLLMRHPGDIELLERPPLWNLTRLLWTVAVLAGLILLAATWVVVLRRRVGKQTRIIRQKLETEEALKNRYEALFENANDMVFTLNQDGCFTAVNSTGEQLLQCERGGIIGHVFTDFVAAEQRSSAVQWVEKVFQDQETSPIELDFVNRAGERFRLEISTRLVRKGGLLEAEGIGRDITERNRLEKEILEISTREQRRIGHDLHDGVCQQLAGIAYRLDMLGDDLQEQGLKESNEAERIGLLINEAVNQTRSVARGLFPVRLEQEGLVATLEELAANAENLFKLTCRFVCEDEPPELERGTAIHLYYIAQEAVVNAAKHGKCTHVIMTMKRDGEKFVLTMQDNGCGIDIAKTSPTGMGIRIMRYRARVIGATLDLQSKPGEGTQVRCTFYPAPIVMQEKP